METMYDRLGDLLNETLEAGEVKFVKVAARESVMPEQDDPAQPEKTAGQKERRSDRNAASEAKGRRTESRPEYRRPPENGTIYHASDIGNGGQIKTYTPGTFIYKKITPELEKAYRLLDIPFTADTEMLKRAYKEKLKYYHPDRHADSEVLQKVATDKTRLVVEAYDMILKFLEE